MNDRTYVFYNIWSALSSAIPKDTLSSDHVEAISAAIVYAAAELSDVVYDAEEVLPELWADHMEPNRVEDK